MVNHTNELYGMHTHTHDIGQRILFTITWQMPARNGSVKHHLTTVLIQRHIGE